MDAMIYSLERIRSQHSTATPMETYFPTQLAQDGSDLMIAATSCLVECVIAAVSFQVSLSLALFLPSWK